MSDEAYRKTERDMAQAMRWVAAFAAIGLAAYALRLWVARLLPGCGA
jgi:hypothetical protein